MNTPKYTVDTWKAAELTGIVINRTLDFMGCIIIPCIDADTGDLCWNRYDKQSLTWAYRLHPYDVIREVDAAYSDSTSEVTILMNDLPKTAEGGFDPYSI